MSSSLGLLDDLYDLKNFSFSTMTLNSKSLKGNPLGDSPIRHNPVLVPKNKKMANIPVIFVLAGFTGNGPNYLGLRSFEKNFPQVIDQQVSQKEAPLGIYVFVDAITFWGGSQFINSSGTGKYEDYIVKDLRKAILEKFNVQKNNWAVMGGSSGGFGALHLTSKWPEIFSYAVAIAPDSYFECCYLPDFFHNGHKILSLGGVEKIKKLHQNGELIDRRDYHDILNLIGMASCYSPGKSKGDVLFPIDLNSGKIDRKVWGNWKKWDPVEFLPKRKLKLKKNRGILLDVGTKDQFGLYFGARQIREEFKTWKSFSYNEFNGNHFDLSKRRPFGLSWLNKSFNKQ